MDNPSLELGVSKKKHNLNTESVSCAPSRNLKSGPYVKSIAPALPLGVGQSHWPPEAAAPS